MFGNLFTVAVHSSTLRSVIRPRMGCGPQLKEQRFNKHKLFHAGGGWEKPFDVYVTDIWALILPKIYIYKSNDPWRDELNHNVLSVSPL